jgi:hypothetical protein
MKLPSGRWESVAKYSGRYTAETSTVYGRCLAQALLTLPPLAAQEPQTALRKLADQAEDISGLEPPAKREHRTFTIEGGVPVEEDGTAKPAFQPQGGDLGPRDP